MRLKDERECRCRWEMQSFRAAPVCVTLTVLRGTFTVTGADC